VNARVEYKQKASVNTSLIVHLMVLQNLRSQEGRNRLYKLSNNPPSSVSIRYG